MTFGRAVRVADQRGSAHIAVIMAVIVMALVGFTGYRLLAGSHAATATNQIVGIGGKCLDNSNNHLTNGNPTQYYTCNNLATQQWQIASNGTIQNQGYCLSVVGGSMTRGARVDIYSCDGSVPETWTVAPNGTIVNRHSGLCLDDTAGRTINGNPIQVYTCNGLTTQQWSLKPSGDSPTGPTPPPTPPPSNTVWQNVINDQFNNGALPSHWHAYSAKYGGDSHNCATPNHATVSGGDLHLLLAYDNSGVNAGAGCTGNQWYSGGVTANDPAYEAVSQRITLRFRIVQNGVTGSHVIPMTWPVKNVWPDNEEDYCESVLITTCGTNLHWNSGTSAAPVNSQIQKRTSLDQTQWHTIRAQRDGQIFTLWIDNLTTPVFSQTLTTEQAPPNLSRVILQQECNYSGCPTTTTGSEDIQIDWITVDIK